MTTIAVRAGVMTADSMMGGSIRGTCRKIIRIEYGDGPGGDIVGGAGNLADVQAMFRWFKAGADMDKPPAWINHHGEKPDAEIIVMQSDGKVFVIDDHMARIEVGEFWAIGSGAKAALGAMHMGADAKRAVEIAAMVDTQTGGDIETATFAPVVSDTPQFVGCAIYAGDVSVAEARYQAARREAGFNGA